MDSHWDNSEEVILDLARQYGYQVESVEREERENPAADKIHAQFTGGVAFKVCDSPLLKIESEAKLRKLE